MSIEATKSSRFLLHLNHHPLPSSPHSPSTGNGVRTPTASNTISNTSTATSSTSTSITSTMMMSRKTNRLNNNSNNNDDDATTSLLMDKSNWWVVLDRFVNASTGDDVTSSLQSILDILSIRTTTNDNTSSADEVVNEFIDLMTTTTTTINNTSSEEDDMAMKVLSTLLHIYHTSQFPKNQSSIFIEDGIGFVGRIYTMMLQRTQNPKQLTSILLLQPSTGGFMEACIDVASATISNDSSSSSSTTTIQPYPRVVALQLIQSVASYQPSMVQHQLLSTPNGIHRLGDLLIYQPPSSSSSSSLSTETVPPEVQYAMITLTVSTLSKWSSVAKIWIFNEVIDHVIRIAIQQEGGLLSATTTTTNSHSNTTTTTIGGNFNVVMDCLTIIQQLLSHDTSLGELVISSSTTLIQLLYYNLLDLRNGTNFRHPPTSTTTTTSSSSSLLPNSSTTNNATVTTSIAKNKTNDDDDDLDDLIASASSSNKSTNVTKHTTGTGSGTTTDTKQQQQQLLLPMLTESEEQMIDLSLDVLCTLLDNPKIAQFILQNHIHFCTLLWEMGLLTLPIMNHTPPTYTCAIPSVQLQQRALHVIGTYLNSVTILEEQLYSGYDRLLYLVCTGMGGVAAVETSSDDHYHNRYRISQAALYVVRRTIPAQTKNDLLIYTLAPPPPPPTNDNEDGTNPNNTDNTTPNVTIVSKLLRTVYDNLFIIPTAVVDPSQQQQRWIALSGALGALSLFLTDDVNRSILFRITSTNNIPTNPKNDNENPTDQSLIHLIFDSLVQELTSEDPTDDYFIAIQLLRFLGTWVTDTPEIVQMILNESTQAMMQLSQFVVRGEKNGKGGMVVTVLIHLLFGLCLHSMKDDMNHGGWTRSNIVTLLQRNSMISQQMEVVKNRKDILPWSCSSYEWKMWTEWYTDSVRIVRQRIIQELVSSTTLDDEHNTINADGTITEDHIHNNTETNHALSGDDTTVVTTTIEHRKEMQTMRKLVTDLTREAERLRTNLNDSEQLVATQDKQLTTWKQRVESTPTELDDMLNAITSKNDDLERTIDDLRSEVKTMESKHATELADRDATIEALRNELSQSKGQEVDIGLERDALRDDMMALSQAYTNLETEYRLQVSASSAAAPSATEANALVPDSDADASGSKEVSTLRAENDRMRQEAQAADEWMSMAVERMQAMTNEIATLQEQVTTSSAAIMDTRAAPGDDAITTLPDQSPERQSNENASLQKQLADMKSQIGNSRSEIEMIIQRELTEISIRDARIQELEATIQNYSTKDAQIESLQQEIRNLNEANDSAQDWMSKAVEHHQALAEQITSLTEQNMELNAQLTDRNLSTSGNDMMDEATSNRLQADILARDDEIQKLKESIASFQLRIEESKEQAVIIARLEQDLGDVRAHLNHVSSQLVSKERELESLQTRMQESSMESRYEDQSNVVESLQFELANRTELVDALRTEISELIARNTELQQKVDDLEAIRIEAGTKEEEILGLRARMAESEARKEAIQKILEAVAKEKEELTSEFDKNQQALEKIESELNKMRRGDLETTQSTEIEENLVELQATIKTLEAQLVSQCDEATSVVQQWEETYSALQSDYNELDSKFQSVLEEKTALETEYEESKAMVVKLQDEIHALRDAHSTRVSELEVLSENLKDQLVDQERDYNETINQWQESYDEIESKLSASTAENADLKSQLTEAKELATKSKFSDDDEKANLSERVKSLEQELIEQEKEALAIVTQWQDSYNAVESKLQETVLENENLLSEGTSIKVTESSERVNEHHDDQLAELILQIKNLEEQLSDQEQEASEIVMQWQESYNAIQATLNTTIDEKNQALEEIAQFRENQVSTDNDVTKGSLSAPAVVSELQNRIEELTEKVAQLEQELTSHEEEANNVVKQWQQCYNDAVAQHEATSSELQSTKDAFEDLKSSSVAGRQTDGLESNEIFDLKSTIVSLEERLQREEAAVSDALLWHEKHSVVSSQLESTIETMKGLEDEVANLQQQLANQISQSNRSVQELQQSLDEMRHREEAAATDILQWQEKHNIVSSQLESAMETVKGLNDEVGNLQQQLADQVSESNSMIQQWQQSYNDMSSKCLAYEKENDAMALELKELKESYASLQSQCDELSVSATRGASLETQYDEAMTTIDNLQQQLDAVNDIINQWQESHSHVTDELKTAMLELQERRDSSEAQQKELTDAYSIVDRSYQDIADLKAQVDMDKETILFLEEKVKTFVLEVQDWQEKYKRINESVNELTEQNANLQSTIDSLQREHDQHIKDRDMAIFDWEQRHAETTKELQEIGQKCTHLQSSLDTLEGQRIIVEQVEGLKQSVAEQSEKLLEFEEESKTLRQNLITKEESIGYLEKQLVEQEEDARNIVMQWQQSYEALQAHCEEILVELEASRETISKLHLQGDNHESSVSVSAVGDAGNDDSTEQMHSVESKADEKIEDRTAQLQSLEAKVEELQNKLATEAEHAQSVISQWQIECTNVASDLAFALGENEELAERLRIADEANSNTKQLDKKLETGTINELQGKIDEVTNDNDQLHAERSDLKNQLEAILKSKAEQDAEFESLRRKLSEQLELEPRLRSNISELESRLSCHLDENTRLMRLVESQQIENTALQDKLTKLTEDLTFQLDKLKSDKARMKATFEAEQRTDKEKLGLIEFEIEGLRRENASLAKERDQLSMRLAELEDKLMQANDTLQILMTDQASKEATEVAAEALREEVRSLHHQAQIDRTTIHNLSRARDDAEAEAERLQNDISTFLGFESYEANRTAIEKRTMEAGESLQRAERNEIRALKTSLSRALDELSISRASEQELEERAAKAMHQASMYEQELVSLKSDFQFLTQTMDEMRESESSRRLSLEYRISSLENEQNVQRHYHTTEMEHIRNELNHVSMERDRLFQSLKESERSKSILQRATSRDRITNGEEYEGDPQIELNRLRMEKAQLLSSAADEASRMEHRLREAHAAAKASADAEIFMERELRIQAEKTLERNLLEMSELRMVGMDNRHGSYNVEQLEKQLENAHNELQKIRNETQMLRTDCSSLRQQLHDSKKEANITIVRLTEECRVAKARCSYIEKETQREAEIRVEVARIQATKSSSTRSTPERGSVLVERNNPASDHDSSSDNMAVTKLYDALQKQKQATEEERVVYFELLNEHDNLLALLAQQDLLKTSYQRTLLRLCGNDAVNTAIREAEEQAQKQYGKYIQLK